MRVWCPKENGLVTLKLRVGTHQCKKKVAAMIKYLLRIYLETIKSTITSHTKLPKDPRNTNSKAYPWCLGTIDAMYTVC